MPNVLTVLLVLHLLPYAGYAIGRWQVRGWTGLAERQRQTAGRLLVAYSLLLPVVVAVAFAGGAAFALCGSGVLAVVLAASFVVLPHFVTLRGVAGCCVRCGYHLDPPHPDACPECGLPRPGGIARDRRTRSGDDEDPTHPGAQRAPQRTTAPAKEPSSE